MSASTLFAWLSARRLELHTTCTKGVWTFTVCRGSEHVAAVSADDVDACIELLQVAVDGSWRVGVETRKAG